MNLSPAVSSLGWVILGLIPPLILMLYFLKLRRTALEVPSTYLWKRTIEDLHVNSIWQRLRNSVLLLLQLLLALLLLLACLGPGCEGERLSGNRFIFLVDQSASASAKDGSDGRTRLEHSKFEIDKLIGAMEANDSAMIIAFSDNANVVQSYTKNRSLLKQKLAGIKQTQRGSDITEALTAASGLANPGRTSDRASSRDVQVADALAATLYIFSDGAVKEVPNFSLGNLATEYFPVGSIDIPYNIGITAFAMSDALDSNELQAFARIQNSDDEDHTVDIELFVNGEFWDIRKDQAVPKEQSIVVSFSLGQMLESIDETVPVKLVISSNDIYAQDNVAYGVIKPARKAIVLVVTKHNLYLESVVETNRIKKLAEVQFVEPEFMESSEYLEKTTLGSYDIVIFEHCVPQQMPQCNTMFIGDIPPTDDWSKGDKRFPTDIIDTMMSHPIMFNVDMNNVQIVEGWELKGPKGTVDLVESTYGTIMALGPRDGFQDLVIGYPVIEYNLQSEEIINSDWYNNFSFPLFMQNVFVTLGGGAKFNASNGVSPGQLVSFRTLLPTKSVTVTGPDGDQTIVQSRSDNTFVFGKTQKTGVYSVVDDESGAVDQLFPVNLLDARESNLAVRDKLELGFEEIKGKHRTVPSTIEYWPWLVLAALFVLTLEWYVYNRRVFI